MILQRKQYSDGKIRVLYESSNILASDYDPTSGALIITFNAGTQYKYDNVSRTDYTRFETAESQGSVFSSHIKKYSFVKLESIDASLIREEILNLKSAEDDALVDGIKGKIIADMRNLLSLHDASTVTDEIFCSSVRKINEAIEKYLEITKTII